MTDETPAAVVAPRDPSFFLVMFVVVITSIFIEGKRKEKDKNKPSRPTERTKLTEAFAG